MKRIIIAAIFILSLCLIGCGQQSQIKQDSSDVNFGSINDIEYSSSVIEEKNHQTTEVKEQTSILPEEETKSEEEAEDTVEEEYYEEEYYDYDTPQEYYYDDSYVDYSYDSGYSGTYYAEYSDLYNEDGPSHTMPGWHDGYLETYYNASLHYLAGTWTLDDEGFYHDENGRYVVGVDINDINPETGEQYQYGDVVDTGKGEGVVYDYGQGAHVHDFATNW